MILNKKFGMVLFYLDPFYIIVGTLIVNAQIVSFNKFVIFD